MFDVVSVVYKNTEGCHHPAEMTDFWRRAVTRQSLSVNATISKPCNRFSHSTDYTHGLETYRTPRGATQRVVSVDDIIPLIIVCGSFN